MKIRCEVIIPGREVEVLYELVLGDNDPIISLFRNGAMEVTATIHDGGGQS